MSEGRKIKIVQVIGDSKLGGGPQHILGLLKHLDKKKFECFLVCPPGYLSREAKRIAAVSVYNLRFASKFDLATIFLLAKLLHKIRSSFDPFGPMIVHTHGARASLGRFFKLPGVRYLYTEHLYDTTFHLKNPFSEWSQKTILRHLNYRSDLIIAVSSSVRDFLLKENLAPKNRLLVVPNAISLEKLGRRRKVEAKLTSPIIGTIGSLQPLKGQSFLIKAFREVIRKYPLAALEIIGDGPERQNLERLIRRLKIDRHISLLGQVNSIEKYIRHWDIFVLPSLAETFGLVILEALAADVPVIASRVGGIPDIICDHENGLLVPAGESRELAKTIEKLLARPKMREKFIKEGRVTAEKFSWEKIVLKIEEIYQKLSS